MRYATRFSGRLAVAVAALAVVALGVGVGNPAVLVGAVGAVAFGWGAGALDTDSNARRALGSVATVVGGLLALVGMAAGGYWPGDVGAAVVTTVGLVGLTAVAVDAWVGLGDETLSPVLAALGSSLAKVIGGVALASVLYVAVGMGLLVAVLLVTGEVALATALGGFVALQLEALLAGVLMGRARRTVETWFPGGVPVEAWAEFEPLALSLEEVPRGYWVALGLQVVLLVAGGAGLVAQLLAATWLFGAVVDATLRSGLLHGALLAVIALELVVLGADAVRSVAVSALSPDPPGSLSYAAGGIVLVLGVPVLVSVLAVVQGLLGVGSGLPLLGGVWGPSAAVLSLSVVALGVVFAAEVTGVALAERTLLPDRTAGFALGAALVFLAAVVAAPVGAPPLAVFAGVAAALVAWDLGETAVDLGSHLGPATDTRRTEVVHATGSLAVAAGSVVLAAASVHLVGPFQMPGTGGRAVVALGLAIVALVAFAVVLDRTPVDG